MRYGSVRAMENHTIETAAEVGAKLGAKGIDVLTIRADLECRFGRKLTEEESQAMFTGWRSSADARRALYRARTERDAAVMRAKGAKRAKVGMAPSAPGRRS